MNQTLLPAEVIVVDDGSTPAVDRDALVAKFGPKVRVLRNDLARGLAYSRNIGVESASSDYVTHLDDDDLLAPEALAVAHAVLSNDPGLDLVFLGVEGFGSRSQYFNRVQPEAVARATALAKGQVQGHDIVYFGHDLIKALLRTVPIAFQRVMLTPATWHQISALRWRAYRLDPAVSDDAAAQLCINGPLRDSEWALYAGAICNNTALINRPLYLQRCAGQGYSSQPDNIEWHMRQALLIKSQLLRASLALPELLKWKKDIRQSLASAEFDSAYHYFQNGNRGATWRHLRKALRLNPNLAYIRFSLRMWLPRSSEQEPS
jgi:glycosyltransferase involved in cell wall biosynthesis